MNDPQTIAWKRIAVEAVVIVASILLAFAIDAWWDDREARHQLSLELVNVMGELQENRKRVELEIGVLTQITTAGSDLLGIMAENESASVVTIPDSTAWLTTVWSPTLDASFGAVDALVSSGRLAQVENLELRTGLAGIRAQFEDALEEEVSARWSQYNLFFPLILDKADLQPLYQYDDEYFAQVRYSVTELPTNVDVDYPNSLAIRNAMRDRMGWLRTGREELQGLLLELDELIELLQGMQ